MKRVYCFLKYSVFFGVLCLFARCNSQSDSGLSEKHITNPADSLIKDVPAFFQDSAWRSYFTKLQTLLDIPSLENGFNEWQIRFWIDHGLLSTDTSQLLAFFKKENNEIRGNLYTYLNPTNSTFDTATTLPHKIDALTPKSGWASFINKISDLGIFDLPDYTKVPNYDLPTDSYGVTVETANRNKYRIYQYPAYESNENIAEAGKLLRIMRIIEDEFQIRVVY